MRATVSEIAKRFAIRGLCSSFLLLSALAPVCAVEQGPYSMTVLIDGMPLDELSARGREYVEALEGREYSVRLTNHTPARVAIALAVDGLNSIDAKTTEMRRASKWILGPYETITIDGWQTGSSTARRFYFTTEDESYGAWLGKTRDLGLISAAVFRERVPHPSPIVRPTLERNEGDGQGAPSSSRSSQPQRKQAPAEAELSDDLAATGIGRQIDHRVRRVRFDAESSPVALLDLRYEYRDALVRLGVVPSSRARYQDPLGRRERSRGFEDSSFAPDPYR